MFKYRRCGQEILGNKNLKSMACSLYQGKGTSHFCLGAEPTTTLDLYICLKSTAERLQTKSME